MLCITTYDSNIVGLKSNDELMTDCNLIIVQNQKSHILNRCLTQQFLRLRINDLHLIVFQLQIGRIPYINGSFEHGLEIILIFSYTYNVAQMIYSNLHNSIQIIWCLNKIIHYT